MVGEPQAPFGPRKGVRAVAYRALLVFAHALYKTGNGFLFTAAGLLRRDELAVASVEQYRSFNISATDVDAGLTPGEAEFYGRCLRRGDRILLVGCGTGRDLIGLRQLGCDVTGLEPIPELVDIARAHLSRRGMSAPMVTGLIQTADLNGSYDAVIFSNGAYAMLQGAASRVATLNRVTNHLAPGGRIIVTYHPRAQQSRVGRWLTSAAVRLSRADWAPEHGDTFSRDRYVPGLVRYHHAFAPGEFSSECDRAGLKVLADEQYSEGYFFAVAERRS